jgi:hypothetical protein
MRIERQDVPGVGHYWRVHVQAGELVVPSGKAMSYPFAIGTIDANGKIKVWTPGAYTPRGYKPVAKKMLEEAAASLRSSGELNRSPRRRLSRSRKNVRARAMRAVRRHGY